MWCPCAAHSPLDCAEDPISKNKDKEALTAGRETQLHICARLQCSAPLAGRAGEGRGGGSTEKGPGGFLEEMMFELGIKERVSTL